MPVLAPARRSFVVSLAAFAALVPGGLAAQTVPAPSAQLPVTRVSLYKNGVGFFEHTGRVTGDQSVTIDFTSAQLNDVLQSLTAIDLNGGRIAGADYNSTTPLAQQLKAMPLALDADPTAVDFYNGIRGARVEVRGAGPAMVGRLLDVEVRTAAATAGKPAAAQRFITVIEDSGGVRTVELTPATEVRMLDARLQQDVARYLQLLASTRNEGLRHLTIKDNGNGTRGLLVSYISEVPIWKSTYRILFTEPAKGTAAAAAKQTATLQGWSVVDNTTGADWVNVQLSLIAGSPQSFIQPLSVPYYSHRPEIPMQQAAQVRPQTHESGEMASPNGTSAIQGTVRDATGAVIPNAKVTATNMTTGVQVTRTTDASGNYSLSPLQPGTYTVELLAQGFAKVIHQNLQVGTSRVVGLNVKMNVGSVSQTVTVTNGMALLDTMDAANGGTIENELYTDLPLSMRNPTASAYRMPGVAGNEYEQAAQKSLTASASGSAFDDYFEYKLADPITIRKNESAMVPILQTKIDAERVTLWSARQPLALRALWITNTSKLTLDRGSFSIVENGNFGGEGLLDPIHPAEKRLLSYAVDQAVRVSTESPHDAVRTTSITAAKGVLVLHHRETADVTYAVRNAAPEARTVVIEHPVRQGYDLQTTDASAPKPVETTPTVYRYRVTVSPGATERLRVAEVHEDSVNYALLNANDGQIAFFLSQANNDAAFTQALQPILAARKRLADAQEAVNRVTRTLAALRSDEDRQRANVTALGNADKAARERFVRDLNASEDKIGAAQKELAAAQAALQAAREDLNNRIEVLQIDEKLPA